MAGGCWTFISFSFDQIGRFLARGAAFMKNKRNLKHRRGEDRRKNPDRRNGYDRRSNHAGNAADNDIIFNTLEACQYLKISRPTYLKYITSGKIKAQKIGRGWKVLKQELDRFIRGE